MSGRVIVITGASDGIGASAARQLAERGHTIVVVGRSAEKTAAVAERIGAEHHLADFAELSSVRALAAELLAAHGRIDVLANNAGGIFGSERRTTVDGHEQTFQVNYLAPFLLTRLLTERLLASQGRVISTSSIANRLFGRLDIDDLDAEHGYSAQKAYGDAKLAQILFTRELHRRYHDRGLSAVAFHPGVIATGFASDRSTPLHLLYQTPLKHLFLRSPDHGARTLVRLADAAEVPSGEYLSGRRRGALNPQAEDAELARALWDRTERMLAGD
ncbi:SDR family NAD(P)-dependent oxidoreductase [Mycetocola reblochoni]|uniref:SDR family NAD(P)-dependent oxidoreductase n=2 Tax=Mycetocola reblochoni TaxID=331618 RepID=A0A3L6ZTT7_9MICO|nr:SDR family NAD(P)-dependent oxidoreductase [Mycetocola reblochoni]RLP71209.1 SDR family NAD(P)-dependent oxidoreductase [Mycetocola reblochoni]SJN25768.1 putative oxidoreductase [Mycetocola reblochoni REB411]